MSNLFQKLELEAFRKGITPRTRESREWFRKKVQQLTRVNRSQLVRNPEVKETSRQKYGTMIMFTYDPKLKDKLPYYDTFPLVIPIEPAKDGFRGLNLHYLPPVLRAKFLDSLLDTTNNKKYAESTRFNLPYNLLTGAAGCRYFRP